MTALEAARARVEAALEARVSEWRSRAPARLCDAMAYSLLGGGKRLRPALVLLSFEACRGQDEAPALDLAVAVECIHTYSLVHDDLPAMDNDDLRRGRPTCHRVFGDATAILAGDALLTEAFAIVADGTQPVRGRLAALLARAAGAGGMVGGQELDLHGEPGTLAEVEAIHRLKTGSLLAVSAEAGAVAAGADEPTVLALRAYGQALGLAFQIADDLLDVTGDPRRMGKHVGGDEARGKRTYPALLGVEGARAQAGRERDRAVAALSVLGDAGQSLREVADHAVERVS